MVIETAETGHSASAGPLGAEELVLADRVARRLHAELSDLINALPTEARNATGLARHLGIDRTTCQRAVFVASRPYPGPELLTRVPGVRALAQLGDAAARAKPAAPADAVAAFAAAVTQFEHLIARCGGSLTRLIRRINATPSSTAVGSVSEGATGDGGAGSRRRLFEAAADLTGRSSQCWVAVYLYRPAPGSSGELELIRANGLIGHLARQDAVPLVFHNFSSKPHGEAAAAADVPGHIHALTSSHADGTPDAVIRPFTSFPLPLVSSSQPNEFLVQAIDENPSAEGRPVDLMFGTRTLIPHPALQTPPVEEAWALVNFPCRHLLFDVYLHRDLARRCIPSLDAHLWRPDFAQNIADRWQTRFASSPTLQLLGSGTRNAASPAWARHAELTAWLFDAARLTSSEFVGYRCSVEFPIWRAGYCVSFDFSPGDTDAPRG